MTRAEMRDYQVKLLAGVQASFSWVSIDPNTDPKLLVEHLWHQLDAIGVSPDDWRIKGCVGALLRLALADSHTVEYVVERCGALREAGQKEYARADDNAFANFERVSGIVGMPREKVLLVYLLKHIDGIQAWADGHKSQREPVIGRICDAIVYLCLLHGMTRECSGT